MSNLYEKIANVEGGRVEPSKWGDILLLPPTFAIAERAAVAMQGDGGMTAELANVIVDTFHDPATKEPIFKDAAQVRALRSDMNELLRLVMIAMNMGALDDDAVTDEKKD